MRIMTKDRGMFKRRIHEALYGDPRIRRLLLWESESGGGKGGSDVPVFMERVKSHLFVEDTITDVGTYIYYDVVLPDLAPQIKECRVLMYLMCHRSLLDEPYEEEGCTGNRLDILSQLVEERLLDVETARKFGIGSLSLDSMEIYNAVRFYGYVMTFSVPNFR